MDDRSFAFERAGACALQIIGQNGCNAGTEKLKGVFCGFARSLMVMIGHEATVRLLHETLGRPPRSQPMLELITNDNPAA